MFKKKKKSLASAFSKPSSCLRGAAHSTGPCASKTAGLKFWRNQSTLWCQPHRAGLYTTAQKCDFVQSCTAHGSSAARTRSARARPICSCTGRMRTTEECLKHTGHVIVFGSHTWLEYGGHLPPGPVLQRPQKLCRLETGCHLCRALKRALSTSKGRSSC